ncbi:AAA family ATPase [Rhodoblastus acidophilus]|uniref:DNA 3'-5' helicase n=1 Tax=Rhodoblastus acidophilus TaxID=1074 RepID=A0A6N8DPM7_RHOAC|nr:3'-5' exonuclease [Rhodoblastus acidophilus]MCW2275301.1 hypothetical protein [Rhodoblastus acidophilus]MTV31806.1 AAA family ATPase [Rhodoblastus acidophilus]
MNFRIADTFSTSLTRLTGQEQKAVKTTAFDLQMDPSAPGLSFHKLDRAQDKNFWSVRVSADIRIIVHKTAEGILLCYVDHHDAAYKWAARRKIEQHPNTGAMQLVEIPERIEEFAPTQAAAATKGGGKRLFDNLRKLELMAFGVPAEWVEAVRGANDDTIFDVLPHLPQEAQEILLRLAVGEKAEPPKPAPPAADPFAHPDAQRRFLMVSSLEELQRALEFPWDKWAVFLHPDQRALVAKNYAGPVRVSGSAGTGKTIVALHRAVHLARSHPDARVLLTTFSSALANALRRKLAILVDGESAIAARIDVKALSVAATDLYCEKFGQPELASSDLIHALLTQAAKKIEGQRFSENQLFGEWSDVVDAWHLTTWESYRDVARLGRRTRLSAKQREVLWEIFKNVRAEMSTRKVMTWSDIYGRLTDEYEAGSAARYRFAVVDEAQDLGVAEARFLRAMVAEEPEGLLFAGDLGQRIFQQPFSWKSLGIDVRGRSYTLRVNYRTSHQIRTQADRLLPKTVTDVDGIKEGREGTVSVFDGPPPEVVSAKDEAQERRIVADWITARITESPRPHEIGVFVRSDSQIERARLAVIAAGVPFVELSDHVEATEGAVAISTMHLAKGLEFRSVAVMACDDDVIPLQERMESIADEGDLEEAYNTERHLLYVACTRARDQLLVTGLAPMSEFLDDLKQPEGGAR